MRKMSNEDRCMAILEYKSYDEIPLIHFSYWKEVLQKWEAQGHITREEVEDNYKAPSYASKLIDRKLGFDFCWWFACFSPHMGLSLLSPSFKQEVIEDLPDGSRKIVNPEGMIQIVKEGISCIPANAGSLLKGRKEWEELFLPKLTASADRIDDAELARFMDPRNGDFPRGLYCGSLYGSVRNWMGVEGISYLYADDPDLFREIIDTVGNLCYNLTEMILKKGYRFYFGHFWEDICFKGGPLVSPRVFREIVAPHYGRITKLLHQYGIEIVSLDCDGKIDELIPIWLENGVNTMYPIEVGTWDASIAPWRNQYGKTLRGVGGMDKRVFAMDYAAVDREIERLKPLVELGGFIPGVDHMISPDAIWENVQYYCDRMRSDPFHRSR
jgi:hypothetical protein